MMSITFAHVLLLTFSCALLAATDSKLVVYFLGTDMALFFLYRIARKDFFYLNMNGMTRLIIAIVS